MSRPDQNRTFLGSISLKMVASLNRWLRWNTKLFSCHTTQSTTVNTEKRTGLLGCFWNQDKYLQIVFQKIPISKVEADTHVTLCYKPAHLLFVVVIKWSLITQKGFCCSWQIYADYIQCCKSCMNIPHICWPRSIFLVLSHQCIINNNKTNRSCHNQHRGTIRSALQLKCMHDWHRSLLCFPETRLALNNHLSAAVSQDPRHKVTPQRDRQVCTATGTNQPQCTAHSYLTHLQ